MKHTTLTMTMCLFLIITASAISTTSAFAEEPMPYLFEFSKGEVNSGGTFTLTGGKVILSTKETTIECENVTGTGEFTKEVGAHLGVHTIILKKCKTSGFNCGNEGSSENITFNKWVWHLVAGFDPKLNRWVPAILLLIPNGEFELSCAGIIKIKIKGKGITGALYKTGTETPLGLGERVEKTDLVFQGESSKSFKLLFSKIFFPLSKTEEAEPTLEAESSLIKKLEPLEIILRSTFEKFEDSAKERVDVELVE